MQPTGTHSRTESLLKGQPLPQIGVGRPVSMILKKNGNRVVVDDNGKRTVVRKSTLLKAFNSVLSKQQKDIAVRSIRVSADNTATAKLGGKVKGVRKLYVSRAAAKRAIERRYGKA